MLYAVGKPVYHKWTDLPYGSWLKDPHPKNEDGGEKIWTTYDTHNTTIYEFNDKAKFRNNISHTYTLAKPFMVNKKKNHLSQAIFHFYI